MENNNNLIVLQNNIEIPTYGYDDVNHKFNIIKLNVFKINYIYIQKGLLNIIVNNYKTSKHINFNNNYSQPFKKTILKAIGEYIEMINSIFIDESEFYVQTNNIFVTFQDLMNTNHSFQSIYILKNNVLTVNKEYNRDVLTKNNLINL